MKQIVFDEPRKVHYLSINSLHSILVRKKGKAFGVIAYAEDKWQGISSNTNTRYTDDSFTAVKKWFGADCEFFVLE